MQLILPQHYKWILETQRSCDSSKPSLICSWAFWLTDWMGFTSVQQQGLYIQWDESTGSIHISHLSSAFPEGLCLVLSAEVIKRFINLRLRLKQADWLILSINSGSAIQHAWVWQWVKYYNPHQKNCSWPWGNVTLGKWQMKCIITRIWLMKTISTRAKCWKQQNWWYGDISLTY